METGARSRVLELSVVGAVSLAVLVLCGMYAYYTIFARFAGYDDEGFVLMSLKFFFKGHTLYDEIYSCYQPFFHVFNLLVFKIWGATLSHDSIRFLTIALWSAGATLNASMAYRLTSSKLLALFVLFLSMDYLKAATNEPGHPQMLTYLLMVAILSLFAFMNRLPRAAFALTVGFLLGLLFLTKINVGVYVLLPVVLVLAAGTSGVIFVRLQAVIGAIMVALPVILMHSRLTDLVMSTRGIGMLLLLVGFVAASFVARSREAVLRLTMAAAVAAPALMLFVPSGFSLFHFAMLTTLSISSAVLVTRMSRPGTGIGTQTWLWGVLGGGTALVAILLAVLLRGTSFQGLLNGLFWAPLTQSAVFFIPCRESTVGGGALALCGLAACCWCVWVRMALTEPPSFRICIAIAKLLFGATLLAYFNSPDAHHSISKKPSGPLVAAFRVAVVLVGDGVPDGTYGEICLCRRCHDVSPGGLSGRRQPAGLCDRAGSGGRRRVFG